MVVKGNARIAVRLYVAATDVAEVNAIRRTMESILNGSGVVLRSDEPSRHWKVPKLFGVFFVSEPGGPVSAAFDQLLVELGSGWTEHRFPSGGHWAVWNPGPQSSFNVGMVQWAHVECFREHDGGPLKVGLV